MTSQRNSALAKLIHNLQFLLRSQAIHLCDCLYTRIRRVCTTRSASILLVNTRSRTITIDGIMPTLRSYAREIRFDALSGLDVDLKALGGELGGGEGPISVLRRGTVEVVFAELHRRRIRLVGLLMVEAGVDSDRCRDVPRCKGLCLAEARFGSALGVLCPGLVPAC